MPHFIYSKYFKVCNLSRKAVYACNCFASDSCLTGQAESSTLSPEARRFLALGVVRWCLGLGSPLGLCSVTLHFLPLRPPMRVKGLSSPTIPGVLTLGLDSGEQPTLLHATTVAISLSAIV